MNKLLGQVRYGEPEAISDEFITVYVNDDQTHVVVLDVKSGNVVHIPRNVAKEVGRTIVKGQNP